MTSESSFEETRRATWKQEYFQSEVSDKSVTLIILNLNTDTIVWKNTILPPGTFVWLFIYFRVIYLHLIFSFDHSWPSFEPCSGTITTVTYGQYDLIMIKKTYVARGKHLVFSSSSIMQQRVKKSNIAQHFLCDYLRLFHITLLLLLAMVAQPFADFFAHRLAAFILSFLSFDQRQMSLSCAVLGDAGWGLELRVGHVIYLDYR